MAVFVPTHDDLVAFATYVVKGHTPRPENDFGLSCDEQGCPICNGMEVEDLVKMMQEGSAPMPDASEVAEAREEMADWEDE